MQRSLAADWLPLALTGRTLSLYGQFAGGDLWTGLMALVDALSDDQTPLPALLDCYRRCSTAIYAADPRGRLDVAIVEGLLLDDNPFSRAAAAAAPQTEGLMEAARYELAILREAAALDFTTVRGRIMRYFTAGVLLNEHALRAPARWRRDAGEAEPAEHRRRAWRAMRRRLLDGERRPGAEALWAFHAEAGRAFARWAALAWRPRAERRRPRRGPALDGPARLRRPPRPPRREYAPPLRRPGRPGCPAHRAARHGQVERRARPRPASRRSRPAPRRTRGQRGGAPARVAGRLRNGLAYLVVIDDLVLEREEAGYAVLKSVLEGGLDQRPSNVRLCVTSNRRHLLRERARAGEEALFAEDERDERLSLAERFGLSLRFRPPTQAIYLELVRHLAQQAGIAVDQALLERALVWSQQRQSRSPRAAAQFLRGLDPGEWRLAGGGVRLCRNEKDVMHDRRTD